MSQDRNLLWSSLGFQQNASLFAGCLLRMLMSFLLGDTDRNLSRRLTRTRVNQCLLLRNGTYLSDLRSSRNEKTVRGQIASLSHSRTFVDFLQHFGHMRLTALNLSFVVLERPTVDIVIIHPHHHRRQLRQYVVVRIRRQRQEVSRAV